MRKILVNSFRTPDGTVLRSLHRHDYKTYTDQSNHKVYMIDGGTSYLRRSMNGDEEDLTLYEDSPIEEIREEFRWGTYGSNANRPIKYIPLKRMSNAHLEACINEGYDRNNIFDRELTYRIHNDIFIED